MISRQNLSLTYKGIYDCYTPKSIYNQIQKVVHSKHQTYTEFHILWFEHFIIYFYWLYVCQSEQWLSPMSYPNNLNTSLSIHSMDLQKKLHEHITYTNTIKYLVAQMENTILCLYKAHHISSPPQHLRYFHF